MNKILILGNSGSGKSTFGQQLSNKLNIELLFLDPIVYDLSWDVPNYPKVEEAIVEMMKKDSFIIDGNFLDHGIERFKNADTIIFLDINRFTCLKSVIERKNMYKDKHRDSRSDNLSERINFSYKMWVLFGFYFKSKPRIKKIIKNHPNAVVLKSRKQMQEYIDKIK